MRRTPTSGIRALRRHGPMLFVLVASLAGTASARAEARLTVSVDPEVLTPGEKATLHVRLVDEDGSPATTSEPLMVSLVGGEGLVGDQLLIDAGQGEAEAVLAPAAPGMWKLSVAAEGYRPAERWVFVPKPLPARTRRSAPQPEGSGPFGTKALLLYRTSPPATSSPPLELRVPPTLSDAELGRVVESLGDIRFDERREKWDLGSAGLATREDLWEASRDPKVLAGRRDIWLAAGSASTHPSTRYRVSGLPDAKESVDVWTGIFGRPERQQLVDFGELRLYAQPESPRVARQGRWDEVELLAVWIGKDGEREVPQLRASPLSIELELRDFLHAPTLSPGAQLVIPNGAFHAAARLTSESAQKVLVGARWTASEPQLSLVGAGGGWRGQSTVGRTESVPVHFVRAPPSRLVFRDLPSRVSGLGPLRRSIGLGLVDDGNAEATSDSDVEVQVRWSNEAGDGHGARSAVIRKGDHDVALDLDLAEAGVYDLTARVPRGRLAEARAKVEYRFSAWLAAVALLGGLFGALLGAVARGDRKWLRVVIVGLGASVVAVLLALFGLLGLLEAALRGAGQLQEKVPVQTTLGMLCIALLAGLAGEGILALVAMASGAGRAARAGSTSAAPSPARTRRAAPRQPTPKATRTRRAAPKKTGS